LSTMISMLHSPTKTFEYIRERGGSFLIPLIMLLIIAVLIVFLQLPIIERSMELQEVNLEGTGISEDTMKQIGVYIAFVTAPIVVAVSTFFMGLLLLLLNLIVRGEATYMQLVKVALFSQIPGLINGLISGIMTRATDAESEQDILFSLGALMQEKEGFLFGVANILNPFTLWGLAILIIGASVMCRRPIRTVGLWIGGLWLVVQLILATLA